MVSACQLSGFLFIHHTNAMSCPEWPTYPMAYEGSQPLPNDDYVC